MSATTTIKNNAIVVETPIDELLQSITGQARADLLESLACDDAVIRHVMDQVLSGLTVNGSCGAEHDKDWDIADGYPSALESARRGVIQFAEPATKRYIERLRVTIRHALQRHDERWKKEREADTAKYAAQHSLRRVKEEHEEEIARMQRQIDRFEEACKRIRDERDALQAENEALKAVNL